MRKYLILFLYLILIIHQLWAGEGIWMLGDLPMETLHEAGFALTQNEIYNPKKPSLSDAIVQIGGGTGSFVSENGLIITNHHVAFSALQTLSNPENNYVKNGYQAPDRSEEIHVPGYKAKLAVEYTDVTEKILSNVKPKMSPQERQESIEKSINALEEKKANAAGNIYLFEVNEFYYGLKYYLFKYIEFQDIHLVYAPPKSIGNYGGDIDNWMWPRHTGDFALFRPYINLDGTSTEFDESNVPYNPEQYLKISQRGITDGDFNFIIGYPGRTQRHRTSYSVAFNVQNSYPLNIEMYTSVIDIINSETKNDSVLQITYANRLAGLKNYLKNFKGMLEGLKEAHLIAQKKAQEEKIIQWIQENSKRQRQYADVLPGIEQIYTKLDSSFRQHSLMNGLEWLVNMYSAASTLEEWSFQKEKPNLDRESEYMERNLPRLKEQLKMMQKQFDPEVDAEIMKYFLTQLAQLPESLQPAPLMQALEDFQESDISEPIDKFVESLYSNTELISAERRLEIFEMSREEMKNLNDPMLDFAMELHSLRERIKDFDKAVEGKFSLLRPGYIQILNEWNNQDIYPDANFTPRLTYGEIRGYSPKDAVIYDYITSLEGIIEKYTGEPPFDAPDKIMDMAIEKKLPEKYMDDYLNNIPVNFVHTTDITGGNSGSPVMDAGGRFIGIAFDGNWESISADWVFNPLLTRSISVDARYILFILEYIAQSDYVFKELIIVK